MSLAHVSWRTTPSLSHALTHLPAAAARGPACSSRFCPRSRAAPAAEQVDDLHHAVGLLERCRAVALHGAMSDGVPLPAARRNEARAPG